jgi:hypothetical protein
MGRRAEDGPLDGIYRLRETPSREYPQRTEWNVRDSDGTLVLHCGRLDRGTLLTVRLAARLDRPHLVVDLELQPAPESTLRWVLENGIQVLNVAGPRETSSPGCYGKARSFMQALLEIAKKRS